MNKCGCRARADLPPAQLHRPLPALLAYLSPAGVVDARVSRRDHYSTIPPILSCASHFRRKRADVSYRETRAMDLYHSYSFPSTVQTPLCPAVHPSAYKRPWSSFEQANELVATRETSRKSQLEVLGRTRREKDRSRCTQCAPG